MQRVVGICKAELQPLSCASLLQTSRSHNKTVVTSNVPFRLNSTLIRLSYQQKPVSALQEAAHSAEVVTVSL